jgi:hypothetical protein
VSGNPNHLHASSLNKYGPRRARRSNHQDDARAVLVGANGVCPMSPPGAAAVTDGFGCDPREAAPRSRTRRTCCCSRRSGHICWSLVILYISGSSRPGRRSRGRRHARRRGKRRGCRGGRPGSSPGGAGAGGAGRRAGLAPAEASSRQFMPLAKAARCCQEVCAFQDEGNMLPIGSILVFRCGQSPPGGLAGACGHVSAACLLVRQAGCVMCPLTGRVWLSGHGAKERGRVGEVGQAP